MATKVYLIPEIGFVQVPDSGTREYLIPEGGFFGEGGISLTHYSLSCSSGSLSLAGTGVEFLVPSNIKANSGSLTLSGTDVALKYGQKIAASSGALSLAGTNVTLTPHYLNKFSSDPSCKALWRFESGALTADSIGTNTLTNSGVAESTGTYFEGSCAADFEYSDGTDALTIDDADLDSGFPLKSGESNRQFSLCFWMRPESVNGTYIFDKGSTALNNMSFAVVTLYYFTGYVELAIWNGCDSGTDLEEWVITNLPVAAAYHVAIMHDGDNKSTTVRMYWPGGGGTPHTYTHSWSNHTAITDGDVAIGNKCVPAVYYGFDGLLDEMVVFDRLISVGEADDIRQGSFVYYTHRLAADSKALSLIGTSLNLKYNKLITNYGEYSLDGNSVDLLCDRKLGCLSKEFSLSGSSVGFVLGKAIILDSAELNVVGTTIKTLCGRTVDASHEELALSGTAVSLEKGYRFLIESDDFSLSGNDLTLRIIGKLSAYSGSLTVTGSDVTLTYHIKDHIMAADSGVFILHGKPVTLKFSGGNPSTLALRINTKLAALSQYSNFNFTSVCYYNGVLLGANNGGIFSVDQDDDLGESINSFFEIFGADFNSNYRKFVRSSTVSGVFDKIRVSVVADSVECPTHDSLYDATVEQKSVSIDMNKDDRGKYIGVKISNIDGSDYSIDGVSLVAGLVQKYSPSEAIVGRSKLSYSGAQVTAGGS